MRVPKGRMARGEWAELLFMAVAARRGLKVSKPHGEARYDVITESDRGLFRVQVKSTLYEHQGRYACHCYWTRKRGKRLTKQHYRPSQIRYREAWHLLGEGGLSLEACADALKAVEEVAREAVL